MLTNTIRFWVYLVFLVPSFICLVFVLGQFFFKRTLRSSLNNHCIILLLLMSFICEVTIYPSMLYYYQFKGIWRRAQIFCAIWDFLDWGLYVTQTMLFAWITIERHILIFHDRLVSTWKKRLFFHYSPPILICLYTIVLYIFVYFFPPCRNYFSNSSMRCIDACLFYNNIYSMWEMIVNQILPALMILIFTIALLVRILWQKHRINQPVQWRKHRKMVIQVVSISILYIGCFLPYALYNLMLTYNVSYRLIKEFGTYSEFLAYLMSLLLPFICAFSIPETRKTILKILYLKMRKTLITLVTFQATHT